MGREIERKFLVKGEFISASKSSKEIIQAYLVTDPEKTVRVRICGDEAFITVKGKSAAGSFTRGEWEYPVPVEDAMEMMKLCTKGRIVKTRYFVPSGNHTFEVDVFHEKNEGLVIAEIELKEESDAFEKPGWLGEEVTGNPAYYNSSLI